MCKNYLKKTFIYAHFNSTSLESRRSHLLCISQHHHLFYHKEVLRGDYAERARPSDKKRKVIAVARKQYFHIIPKLQLFACHIIVLRTHWIYFFIFYFSGFRPTRLFFTTLAFKSENMVKCERVILLSVGYGHGYSAYSLPTETCNICIWPWRGGRFEIIEFKLLPSRTCYVFPCPGVPFSKWLRFSMAVAKLPIFRRAGFLNKRRTDLCWLHGRLCMS